MKLLANLFNSTIDPKGFQKWIGYTDVKSAPVHFYVQRNSSFSEKGTPIPFDLMLLNEGNAMNLSSGIFTAPRTGIYFFSFTGLAEFPTSSSSSYLRIGLYLNRNKIESGVIEEGNTLNGQNEQVTLQSTLNLKKGDQIWVEIDYSHTAVYLIENSDHHTHFTGFMLEEEIVASL